MNPEEREKYLEYLRNSSMQDKYNESLGEEQDYLDEWDYYAKQYDYSKDNFARSTDQGVDIDQLHEAKRLGADYRVGSEFNEENLWRKQGTGEQLGNATNRFLWNTIYDTVGGTAAMVDLPGYWDPNKGVFKDVAQWAADRKKEVNKAAPIHQKPGAGMFGPGWSSWWIDNGSSLASSAASFALQGAGVGKALQGAKFLASLNKIGKVDDLGRRGASLATGETLAGTGKSGAQIGKGLERGDAARNLAASTALTQSAAIMSATETYSNIYDEAVKQGYGEDYAKRVAGQAASNVVNLSRANILLNMSSANRFLGGSKNITGLKPESFKRAAVKEGVQEGVEENVELIVQKQAESEARQALDQNREVSQLGLMPHNLKNLPLLSGNVYGDATWKEIAETSVLGAIGGIAQTGLGDVSQQLGSSTGRLSKVPGLGALNTKLFGKEQAKRHESTEYYPDGTVKHYAGDPVYKTEDVMIEDDKGNLVPKKIKSSIDPTIEEVQQKVKLDDSGEPIPEMEKAKFSQKEIERQMYDRQRSVLEKFKGNIEKNARTISTAKYQSQLEQTISDINEVVEKGKGSLTKDKREKLIDDLARIEMVNSGTVEFDSDESQTKLAEAKKKVATDLDSWNEKQMRAKQDEMMEFSLARTAVESFESNTKEHLVNTLKEMREMTPEQAAELGYTDDYQTKIDEAIGKIDVYYDRWMEYNTKRSGSVARALFNNRLKYDILGEEVKTLNDQSKSLHESNLENYAAQNDIDLDGFDQDAVSNKKKFDDAYLIEQNKNKKLLADKKLKELEVEQEKLQEELEVITADDKTAKDNPAKYEKELRDKNKEIDKSLKSIQDRKNELSKPFDSKIKELGIGKFKLSPQGEVYTQKLEVVEQAKELDKIFDELASEEGQLKLRKIERKKELEKAKRRAYLATMAELLELQNQGHGIYWKGRAGTVSRSVVTGDYAFKVEGEDAFVMPESQQDVYDSIVIPGKEKEWENYKRDLRKNNEGQIESLTNEIKDLTSKINKNNDQIDPLNSELINVAGRVETTGYADAQKENLKDDTKRKESITEINRLNKLLNRPIINNDLTPSQVVRQEAAIQKALGSTINKLTKNNNESQDKLNKTQTDLDALHTELDNIIVPEHLRLYTTQENEDGSITVTQSEPISIPLSYDNINNLSTADPEAAKVNKARQDYMKAYASKLVTLNNLDRAKSEMLQGELSERQQVVDKHNEIVDTFQQLVELRNFIEANKLGKNTIDFSDPIANQFNMIVATFRDTKNQIFDDEANRLTESIDKFKSDLDETNSQINEIDTEIDDITSKIADHQLEVDRSTGRKRGAHKSWIKRLNKNLKKARKVKRKLQNNIDFRETQISKYSAYVELLNNTERDVDFVKKELNNLRLPIQQLQNDLEKLTEGVALMNDQLTHIDERIAYNMNLQDQILNVLTGREQYVRNERQIESLQNQIDEEFQRVGRVMFDSDEGYDRFYELIGDLMYDSEFDIDAVNSVISNMGLDESSDLYQMMSDLESLINSNNDILNNVDIKSSVTNSELQSEFNQLQLLIANDLQQKEILETIRVDEESRLASTQNRINQLETINGGTIYMLSRLDKKLTQEVDQAMDQLNNTVNDINNKLNEQYSIAADLSKVIADTDDTTTQLTNDINNLRQYSQVLADSYNEFMKSDDNEFMNEMIDFINGTVDADGNNKLIKDLESTIALMDKENEVNVDELNDLGRLINLQKEFVAALLSNDLNMSTNSLVERKRLFKKLDEMSTISNSAIVESYTLDYNHQKELLNELNELNNTLITSSEARRKQSERELDLLRLIFNEQQPQIIERIVQEKVDTKGKEDSDSKTINEDLSEGGDILEDDVTENTDEDPWKASKDSIFTTVPRHLEFDNKTGKRKFDNEGLPILSENQNDLNYMNFLNSFAKNPNDLYNNHQVEFIQLSKLDADGNRVVRDPNDPLNDLEIYQSDGSVKSALQADIDNPGIISLVTNKSGERAQINENGDILYSNDKVDGYNPVFTYIPNPDSTKFPTTIGDNMIIRKLDVGNNGYTKFEDFGDTISYGGQLYSTGKTIKNAGTLEQLKSVVKDQIKIDMRDFRQSIESTLNNNQRVISPITHLSKGDLLRRENGQMKSASWLFNDGTFDKFVRTREAKGEETTVDVNDTNQRIISGVPYILTQDGSLVDVHTKKLNDDDIDLVMKLIDNISPNPNEWNKSGSFKVEGSNETREVNLMTSGEGISNIGLMNKVLNWTGPGDNKKFSIWISGGQLNFVKKDGTKRFVPIESIKQYTNGQEITNNNGKKYFPEFLEFLKDKRKHIHFGLTDSNQNLNEEYAHPILVNGEIELRVYPSYADYLKNILETDVLNPAEMESIGATNPTVGKYVEYSNSITDLTGNPIAINNVQLEGVTVTPGMELTKDGQTYPIMSDGNTMTWNNQIVNEDNISDFTFPTVEVIKDETEPDIVELENTSIPILGLEDKLTFVNAYGGVSGGKAELGDFGVQINTVSVGDDGFLVQKLFGFGGETFMDFYTVEKDGTVELISPSLEQDESLFKSIKDRFNIGNTVVKLGSELNTDSRQERLNNEYSSLGLDRINSISDFVNYYKAFDPESIELNNTLGLNDVLINQYLPYLASGDPKFASGLTVQNKYDSGTKANYVELGVQGGGPTASSQIILTSNNPDNLNDLMTEDTFGLKGSIYGKLINQLTKKGDNVNIKYIPHIHPDARIKGDSLELSLGAIVRSNKTPKHIGATIAHELIHRLDKNSKVKDSENWKRLVDLRDAVSKHLLSDLNSNAWKLTLNSPDGSTKYNSMAYWLFNKKIDQNELITLLSQMKSPNLNELMNKLGVADDGMTEFFANVMNQKDFQEFLNNIPTADLDLKTKRTTKNVFKAFLDILNDILKSVGIKVGLIKNNALEDILITGASFYKENGLFTDVNDEVVYEQILSDPEPAKSNIIEDVDITDVDDDLLGLGDDIFGEETELDKVIDSVKSNIDKLGVDPLTKAGYYKLVNSLDSDTLSEMEKLTNEELENRLDDLDENWSLDSTLDSTEQNNENEVLILDSWNGDNYIEALGKIPGVNYTSFITTLATDPDYKKYIEGYAEDKIPVAMNNFVGQLLDDMNNGDEIKSQYSDALNTAIDYIDKNYLRISKQKQMSKDLKKLSSVYDFKGETVSQLELDSTMESMTYFLFDIFRNKDADAFFTKELNEEQIYKNVRKKVKTGLKSVLDVVNGVKKGKKLSDFPYTEEFKAGVDLVKEMIDINRATKGLPKTERLAAVKHVSDRIKSISKLYNKFFNNTESNSDRFKELVRSHINTMRGLGFELSEDAIDNMTFENETEAEKDRAFNKASTEINQKNSMPAAIKLLVASQVNQIYNNQLSEQVGQDVFENTTNYIGLPKPNEFNDMYNLLVKKLANNPSDRSVMMEVLTDLFNKESKFSSKGSSLKGLADNNSFLKVIEKAGQPNPNITLNELRLITQFVQTFSKFTPKFYLSRIDNDGNIHYFDANKHRASEQLLSKWDENFKRTLKESAGQAVIDQSMAEQFRPNMVKAKKVYTSNRPDAKKNGLRLLQNELAKVGITVNDINKLNDQYVAAEGKSDALFNALLAKDSIGSAVTNNAATVDYNPFSDSNISGTMKTLAENVVDSSNQAVDNQFISIDGKTIYAATLNHFISTSANKINYSADKGTMRKDVPHLFNVFNKNSIVRNWLENKEASVEIGMFNGLVAAGQQQGTVTKSLDSPDKWSMLLSSTLKGHYTFFRAADRGTENSFTFRDKSTNSIKKLYDHNRGKATDAFYGYLLDEVNAMVQYRDGLGKDIKFYGDDHSNPDRSAQKGSKFRFFSDGKISDEVKKLITDAIDKGQTFDFIVKTHLEPIKGDIKNSIVEYFRTEAGITWGKIKSDGLLDLNPESRLIEEVYITDNKGKTKRKEQRKPLADYMYFKGISPEMLKPYITFDPTKFDDAITHQKYMEAIDELLLDFNLFQTGAYIEQSKLFTGDPAMYKNSDDFFKRMSMMNSTKKVSVMDPVMDSILNTKNGIQLEAEGKVLDYNLSKEQLITLIENDYKLSKLDKDSRNEINKLVSKGTRVSLKPMLGFNPNYILSGDKYDGNYKSIIIEDVGAVSELAVDNVDRITIDGSNLKYLDSNGDETIPSKLRKTFAESFLNDGITNETRLMAKVNSYLKPYLGMDEADAQAYVTLPGYKEILLRAGDWTDKHEKAYQKMIMGKPISTKEVMLFRVLKTQATGPMGLADSNKKGLKSGGEVTPEMEDSNLFIPTGYKHSIFPLLPDVVKGTNLQRLNELMSKEGVTMAHMTSANKFGRKLQNKTTNQVYDDSGKFILGEDGLVIQDTSFEYLGVQLDQAPKMKGKITTSTQFRKLVLSNLLEQGTPYDFTANTVEQLKNEVHYQNLTESELEDEARLRWEEMTESEKLANSHVYNIYDQYQNVQRELFKRPFDKLINELDLTAKEEDGQIVSYSIGNKDSLIKVAMEMAMDRGASDNVKNSIESLSGAKSYIEHILSKDKVENVLFAIINARVVREKRKGEGAPQVAVSMFEGMNVQREGDGGNRFSSPELRHYISGKDGKTLPSHCMVGLPSDLRDWAFNVYGGLDGLNTELDRLHAKLDAIEIDGEDLVLTDDEKNLANIITTIGFRIPNQGLQSSDYMRVRKFLPTAVGDSIVVPTEMVAKAGSDFDIDKINMYFANYTKPTKRDGVWTNPVFNTVQDDSNSTIEERYINYTMDEVSRVIVDEAKEAVEFETKEQGEEFIDLMQQIFGATSTDQIKDLAKDSKLKQFETENTQEYKMKLAEELAKKYNSIDLEKFNNLSMIEQQTKTTLQNMMLNLHSEIMSLPYNYRQLMAPVDDSIAKNQAWDIRALNTESGIRDLQSILQPERERVLDDIIKRNGKNIIMSIITGDGSFIKGSDLTVTTNGRIFHGNNEVDLKQVNLTPDGQFQFLTEMAPIYHEAKTQWIKDDDARRKNKPLAEIASANINIDKFTEFLSGKAGVGQTAVHITHHQLAMAANMGLNSDTSYWIFDHKKVDGRASFANKKDMDGEWISETLSAFVNSYVDIAKDAYVFDMNAGNRTANMMLMMVRAGASIPWVTKFISQPIVKDYIQAQRKNESMFNKAAGTELSKKALVENVMGTYGVKFADGKGPIMIYDVNETADKGVEDLYKLYQEEGGEEKRSVVNTYKSDAIESAYGKWDRIMEYRYNGMFTEERLGEYILFDAAGNEYNSFLAQNPNIYDEAQAQILDMFLEYQRQSKDFQMMIRATSADTKGAQKNMDDNNTFLNEVEFVKFKNVYTNLDQIYDKSVVSQVHKVVEAGIKMFKPLYYYENNDRVKASKTRLTNLIEASNSMNADRRSKLKSTYNNDLTTAIVTSDIMDNDLNPRKVFNELFIKHDSNTYYNSKGEKAPLAEIIFELNNDKIKINSVRNKWSKGNMANKPSIIDLATLKGNDMITELLGAKPKTMYKSYTEFKNKSSIESTPKFYTLQSRSRRMDINKENSLRNAFIVIKETNPKLYTDLIRVAVNQSGVHHNSPITYSNLIPNEDISSMLQSSFEAFDRLTNDEQNNLLTQFENQFLQRQVQFTPNVKFTKKKNGWWVNDIDARGRHPHLIRMRYDKPTNSFITEAIKPTVRSFKGRKQLWYSSQKSNNAKSYAKLKSANGNIRGHGRFFVGYDLSLDNNGEFDNNGVKELPKRNDNVGEILLAQEELSRPKTQSSEFPTGDPYAGIEDEYSLDNTAYTDAEDMVDKAIQKAKKDPCNK